MFSSMIGLDPVSGEGWLVDARTILYAHMYATKKKREREREKKKRRGGGGGGGAVGVAVKIDVGIFLQKEKNE